MYDSSLESKITGLKHTWKLKKSKKKVGTPPLPLKRFPDTLTGFVTLFRSVVERHAPIKMKTIRGNNKPFMNSELSNAIKQKSKLRNKHNKLRSKRGARN